MARVSPMERAEVDEASGALWDQQVAKYSRMTNMKKTLARSHPSFYALMQWYPLRDRLVTFLGERCTTLFAHALSSETDCLICSTFFRRILIDAGEDPDHLELNDKESLIVEFGRAIAKDSNGVGSKLLGHLQNAYNDEQMVDLTTFAGMMIATNIFNNVLDVDLDDYLEPYRGMGTSRDEGGA